jgi:hypothetical protein
VVTTLTTVGFGDPAPTTAPRKIFTILYIFVGLGIIGGFLNGLTKHTFARRRRRGGPVKSRRARLKTRRALPAARGAP